ncbi:MAG: RHS repeat-associated core domain-containing protein [Ignavibacteriales bacterium]|nr:RHS repeat-associated core domain-containing protein [Ignavibacteriales bacterium]
MRLLGKYYFGGFEYNAAGISYSLVQFPFSEGRVLPKGGGLYGYEYFMKDHLGNVRVSFEPAANNTITLTQEDYYYPFGLRVPIVDQAASKNRYLYNGKELVDFEHLNWYDYGARWYDPQLGRWHVVDPADEFHSPYVYVGNDPVNYVDPDGMESIDPTLIFGEDGQFWGSFEDGNSFYTGIVENAKGNPIAKGIFNDNLDALSIISSKTGSLVKNVDGFNLNGVNLSFQSSVESTTSIASQYVSTMSDAYKGMSYGLNKISLLSTIAFESREGVMDFANFKNPLGANMKANSYNPVLINGVFYNQFDAVIISGELQCLNSAFHLV